MKKKEENKTFVPANFGGRKINSTEVNGNTGMSWKKMA